MKIAGIISEYNPIHAGHIRHIALTRAMLASDAAAGSDIGVVCVMSGNFVQRGDLAIFEKHCRAEAAVACGADLVIELPLPYVLSSAERFARGGVMLLEALGVVTHLSFGSEAGNIDVLQEIADGMGAPESSVLLREEMKSGISYPAARQKAAVRLLGEKADAIKTPNNILGIEYLSALRGLKSDMIPLTVRRIGAMHDAPGAESASYLRQLLQNGETPWNFMPETAAAIFTRELDAGRGPVLIDNADTAILSRLRMLQAESWARLPDATEGLQDRLMRCARLQPTLAAVLDSAKTKRYPLSRLRRMALCAVLGITEDDTRQPPAYIRVLAMNRRGAEILREVNEASSLPVITKPAQAKLLPEPARSLFQKVSNATDFYVLAYPGKQNRSGGQEWTTSPKII